jgi:hypothetical protein
MKTSVFRAAYTASGLGLGFIVVLLLQLTPPALGQDRTAGTANAVTLPQLFPELADLPQATALTISIGWLGLSRLSPIGADYSLALRNHQFEGEGRFKVETASATRAITVPTDIVRAFLAAVIRVELVESGYTPRIVHTDDYPSLSVTVRTARGPLLIETRSQQQQPKSGTYVDRTPWAINYSDRTFVVAVSDLDRAFEPLQSHMQYTQTVDELANKIQNRNDQKR